MLMGRSLFRNAYDMSRFSMEYRHESRVDNDSDDVESKCLLEWVLFNSSEFCMYCLNI